MAKEYYDDDEIIWRTIGGRRIPIRKGQSLSEAMKESGKFKKKDKEQESKKPKVSERDAKDLIKQLNDEGSDFTFGDVKIEDGKIKTTVGVFMPYEDGYVEKEINIPLSKDDTYDTIEEKLRDWQSRHNTPNTFYDKDFAEDLETLNKEGRTPNLSNYEKWLASGKKWVPTDENKFGKKEEDELAKLSGGAISTLKTSVPENKMNRIKKGTEIYYKGDQANTPGYFVVEDFDPSKEQFMTSITLKEKGGEGRTKKIGAQQIEDNYVNNYASRFSFKEDYDNYRNSIYENYKNMAKSTGDKAKKESSNKINYQKRFAKDGTVMSQEVKISKTQKDDINKAIEKEIADGYPNYKDYANDKVSAEMYLEKLGDDYSDTNLTTNRFVKNQLGNEKIKADRNTRYTVEKESSKPTNYRDSITNVAKNSKEDNVTLDSETGKPVSFKKGYSVSFQQSTDNYSDEEYNAKVEECKSKCDGKLYAGKYGGDAEASFHTDSLEDAKEIMYKYNQESIYDWEHDTLIMNDKYDASKNKTNYKPEQTTNEIMNDAIRSKVNKKRGKVKDNLPKKVKIESQGTSNRKEVSENIQAHILDYYDSPDDFISQMDAMSHLPTNWHRGEELAKGGSYLIYYADQRKFLDDLKINPKGKEFSDDRVAQTYNSLIGRESAKLYERLKRNAYNKYLREHPNSNMTFAEFKEMVDKEV